MKNNSLNIRYSIVVPCYNESVNIPILLDMFNDAILADCIASEQIELILVDNGSVDDTHKILCDLLPKYSFARSIRIEQNIGYGNGIKQGLKSAYGEVLAYTHADLQTSPNDVLRGFAIYDACRFIKGNRKGRAFGDVFFTFGMSVFESLLFGTRLYDINAQPTIFDRNFFETIQDNMPLDFSLDLYLYCMAKKMHLDIKRFSVRFPRRIHGVSSWNTSLPAKWRFIKRTLTYSLTLKSTLKRG